VIADRLAEAVRARLPDAYVARDEVSAIVERGDLLDVLAWLRELDGVRLGFLSSITVSDWPGSDPRFWISYDLRSMPERHRLRLKVGLPEHDPHVPSVTGLFPTANWLERETFDFYGIVFDGHPDLTRILLPADWQGHPLRKDEPLGGVPTWFDGVRVPPIDQRGMA
jgi:NADH-quinone oxidoreductase subunit C